MKKRKRLQRVVCCAMSAMLLTILLSGCGDEKTALKGNGEIPKELSVFGIRTVSLTDNMKDYNDVVSFQMMEEATGCHINWTIPPSGGQEEKFNLMIASGNYPDAIISYWGTKNPAQYAKDNVILPLKDIMNEHMPNFKKFCDEHPEYLKDFTSQDGEIYYIPYIRTDQRLNTFVGPLIRQDWLDKLNLSVPVNADELYHVLKAFKTQDPNGNGEADEIPMTGIASDRGEFKITSLLWMFDTDFGFYQEDGKVKYGVMEDNFTEGMKYIAKLYNEGLIDADYILQDRTKMDGKITGDKVGFVYSYQPTKISNIMEEKDPNFKLVGIPNFTNESGVRKVYNKAYSNSVLTLGLAITTKNPDPIGTAKWLDWAYGEEGVKAMNYGREGESYIMEDGKEKFTDLVMKNPDGLTMVQAVAKYSGAFNSYFPTLQEWNSYSQSISKRGIEAIERWADNSDSTGCLPSNLPLTAEERSELSELETTIETYAAEWVDKIILGQASVDNLSEIRDALKKMNVDHAIEIYQTALDRYNAQ